MMKAILGSALGGVVAGVVALMAAAQGRAPEPSWSQAQSAAPYAMTVGDARVAAHDPAASMSVQCEPHQEPVLQRALVAGREVAQVTCVTRAAAAVPHAAHYAQPAYAGCA